MAHGEVPGTIVQFENDIFPPKLGKPVTASIIALEEIPGIRIVLNTLCRWCCNHFKRCQNWQHSLVSLGAR